MASPLSPMKEVEDKFFECSLCLQNFKDPKQLPCLHRYCRDCLQKIIEKDNKTILDCPLCKSTCEKPAEGADGFKTDFFVKSLLEYIQLQTSFEEDKARVCISCSKKCKNFLCEPCYQIYLTSKMFTEHQQHLLNLKNVEAKTLALQKLASLTEVPMCHDHPKFMAQLCCVTCDNLPVCVTCTYNKHKNHDLQDVSEVAKKELEKMQAIIDELNIHKEKLYELQRKVKDASETLKANIIKKTDKLIAQHRSQLHKIERKLKENDVNLDQTKSDIIENTQKECEMVQREYDEKIEKLRAECKDVIDRKKELGEKESEQAQEKHDDLQADLYRKLGALDDDLQSFRKIIDTLSSQNEEAIREIAEHSDHTIIHFENFTATTSTLLSSNDDWTNAQCLPDIRSASEPLIRDVKRDFPELASLNDFRVRDLPSVFDVKVTVTGRKESVIDVEGVKDNNWEVWNMASFGADRIVITGKASDEYSFISVVNMKGDVLRQDKIREVPESEWYPHRYCDSVSRNHIVTLCQSGQLGCYDVRDGSHTKKNIRDITSGWSSYQLVSCVTADPINNTIYVGSRDRKGSDTISRDVLLVFDDKLSYRHTVSLPEIIIGSIDITVHDGDLLVCDYDGKKAHAVNIDGQEVKHVHEFIKPDHDGSDWNPLRVCKDSNDYIYMIWRAVTAGTWRQILTQYSQDRRQLLRTIPVVGINTGLCTVATIKGEKLLIAGMESGKLYTYGLLT